MPMFTGDEVDPIATSESESEDEAPTMPPPPLPDGPIVEVLAVNLRNDPRAE
jgi:hypothetical protein